MRHVADDVGQVLVQGAPELDVEDLAAAADGKHGEVGPQRGGQQGPLARVTDVADAAHLGRRLFAVRQRVDVAAAGQDEAVEDGDHVVGAGLGPAGRRARRGEEERPAAGGRGQLEIRLGQHA